MMQDRIEHDRFADVSPGDGEGPGDPVDGPPGVALETFWMLLDPERSVPDA